VLRGPGDLVFGTMRGQPQSATNVRQRVLNRAIARTNERLADRNAGSLPSGLTLHSLRRTYASILFAIGRTAPEVMEQLGHSDARLTLRIYARAMRQDEGERERLQALVDGISLGTIGHQTPSKPARGVRATRTSAPKNLQFAGSSRVEPAGLEPATSCLQSRRSPS
jgi:hypothetical protein